MTFATALFDQETVERWAGYLRRVLREMAADEHQPWSVWRCCPRTSARGWWTSGIGRRRTTRASLRP
ncbi:hypothetical protein [Longimicrobium terrae]|uniref:hypothetical protein n=1 Tax=Longimicrobium terrae TaxID=1639882 RepID=UPI00147382FD|nr:hypothetical protein [Longimicrobium terrae]NNC31365.1 hypothetical protein [Longimicrobium terrae]